MDGAHERLDALAAHDRWYADIIGQDIPNPVEGLSGTPDLDSPLILDTDIGGDPDDAVALVAAAQQTHLAMVVTSDETPNGTRAIFARALLDAQGRPDVPVVRGASLGNTRYVALNGVDLPDAQPSVPCGPDVIATAVTTVLEQHPTARWVGLGPLTNLAHLTSTRPDLTSRLHLTQMGGALNYRHPDRAEHNIRLDVPAAHQVLATMPDPVFVLSDVTFTPQLEITAGSRHHRLLTEASPSAGVMLRAHLQDWYDRFHPGTIQHDALTLSCALGLPFVDLHPHTVSLDTIGRLTTGTTGRCAWLSTAADYPSFNRWLHDQLVPASKPTSARPHPNMAR